jgi:5-methylcytosine-specific restriction enzyme B
MQITASALLPYPERSIANSSIIERINVLWDSSKKFLVLSGPPGTGKTRAAEDYVSQLHRESLTPATLENSRVSKLFPDFRTKVYSEQEIREKIKTTGVRIIWDLVVLHPQYSYEDLIRGFRAEPAGDGGGVALVVREGLLGFASRVAHIIEEFPNNRKDKPICVLVLDEINRAPIGQLFGEALYALDRRGSSAVTPYPLEGLGSTLVIPSSLLVLGTMNSIDRATSGFDFALRRRFANIPVLPSKEPVTKYWNKSGGHPPMGAILYDLIFKLINHASCNGSVPVSELMLGHAYFLPPENYSTEDDRLKWLYTSYVYQILPTLQDYAEQGLLEYQDSDLAQMPLGKNLDSAVCSSLNFQEGVELFKANLSNVNAL